MNPHAQIKVHQDAGDWVLTAHRIHVPIVGNPDVVFEVCHFHGCQDHPDRWQPVPVEPGSIFELNNVFPHQVSNNGPLEHIHLLIDDSVNIDDACVALRCPTTGLWSVSTS
jgi:hypothetical protein